jgi:hypothetical protein
MDRFLLSPENFGETVGSVLAHPDVNTDQLGTSTRNVEALIEAVAIPCPETLCECDTQA